jgi:hypothetical protein
MFFHCQTTLVGTFRERYGDLLSFEGNRAVLFSVGKKLPEKALKHCVAMALTYHLRSENDCHPGLSENRSSRFDAKLRAGTQ